MQTGKIQDNILKRSITNIVGKGLPEELTPGVGRDCAFMENGAGIICSASAAGMAEGIGPSLAVYKAANNIWAGGGRLAGVESVFFLSENTEEFQLKSITRNVMAACEKCNTRLVGGHTEVFSDMPQAALSVTAIGTIEKRPEIHVIPGDFIVATKWMGLEQMAVWISNPQVEKVLEERFSRSYIDTIRDCGEWLTVYDEAMVAAASGAKLMHDVSDGGIFGALFEVSERLRMGFDIDFKAIPVRQEIMEASTFLKVNPYRMKSSGSLLIVCANGNEMVSELNDNGIPACVIGRFTDNKDKIIRNGEDVSCLARK